MKNDYSCLRSLRNPNSEGFRKDYSTEGNYPDTYDYTFYYRGEDARTYSHINSTVLSHWFYLVSVGGSGTNDLGNQYNVSSIGITNATAIAWQAELYYFTATTNFSLAREAFIEAASDLFGENSCQVINVTNAWYAVGVGSAFQLSDVTISGTTLVCSSGATFTVNNLPPSCTVSWEKTGNLTLLSSNSNGDTAVFASNSNGPGWIRAFINSASCGTSYPTPYFEVWSGTFESTFVTGQVAVCPDSYYTYTAQVPGGHKPTYSYSWTYPSNWYNYDQYQNTISLVTPLYNPDGGAVRVSVTNACGTSGYSGITVYPDYYNCGGYFSLYPNPASEIITITNKISSELETKVEDLNKTYTVRILDIYSNLHFSGIRSGDTFTIPINNLTDGNYIVQISDGKNIFNLKLIIKH
ncbi:MAG: M4 family metallopeptidase [Bacteroidales bacterium]|nr:M4 family metallopeptidase [Bacteroidales bacterium]